MKTVTAADKLSKTFEGLCELHPLRPIRDDAELADAQELLDALAVLDRRKVGQEEYLESLSILVEHYEKEHHAIDGSNVGVTDILRHLITAAGMSESDLGRLLGDRALGNAILKGRRQLSKAHIKVLSRRFGVRADLFLI
jgi:HTH-type transcriptional regulator / antitoxin HigA